MNSIKYIIIVLFFISCSSESNEKREVTLRDKKNESRTKISKSDSTKIERHQISPNKIASNSEELYENIVLESITYKLGEYGVFQSYTLFEKFENEKGTDFDLYEEKIEKNLDRVSSYMQIEDDKFLLSSLLDNDYLPYNWNINIFELIEYQNKFYLVADIREKCSSCREFKTVKLFFYKKEDRWVNIQLPCSSCNLSKVGDYNEDGTLDILVQKNEQEKIYSIDLVNNTFIE